MVTLEFFRLHIGSVLIGAETEAGEEMETCDKSAIDNSLQKTEVVDREDQNPASAVPTTPLQFRRYIYMYKL